MFKISVIYFAELIFDYPKSIAFVHTFINLLAWQYKQAGCFVYLVPDNSYQCGGVRFLISG